MLKKFENWLLQNNYKPNTAKDYQYRIKRVCKKENISLDMLVENINNLLPEYELSGAKAEYGRMSHESVKQALRRFNKFLMQEVR